MPKNIIKLWFSIRYSYNQKWSKLNLANSKLRFALSLMLITISSINAQSNIDKTYEFFDSANNLVDNFPKVDYSVCASNTNQSNYIAVTSFLKNCDGFIFSQIKVIEFDSNGAVLNQTLLCSPAILNSVALDIHPLKKKNGYIICGYMDPITPNQHMRPISVKIKNNFQKDTQVFFNFPGMFSRMVENDSSEFIFVGYEGDSTDLGCDKNGLIVVTDSNFVVIKSFRIPSANFGKSLTNLNDVDIFGNNNVIIAGSLMTLQLTDTFFRVFIINLNTSTGLIDWQINNIPGNYASPKVAIGTDFIFVIANEFYTSIPFVAKYDLFGNFINSKFIEFNTFYNCNNNLILSHVPLLQNIFIIGKDSLLLTGKFLNGQNGNRNEYPLEFKVMTSDPNSLNWNVYDSYVIYTDYVSINDDVCGYKPLLVLSGYASVSYTTDNTTKLLDNKYVTTTYTNLINTNPQNVFKTWTFSNYYSNVIGRQSMSSINLGGWNPVLFNEVIALPMNIHSEPYFLNNEKIVSSVVACPRRGQCCNN